jgi:hypothetical protein
MLEQILKLSVPVIFFGLSRKKEQGVKGMILARYASV